MTPDDLTTQTGVKNMTAKSIPAADREHIDNLIKWAAQAAARGDVESSERLLDGAHRVMGWGCTCTITPKRCPCCGQKIPRDPQEK